MINKLLFITENNTKTQNWSVYNSKKLNVWYLLLYKAIVSIVILPLLMMIFIINEFVLAFNMSVIFINQILSKYF